MGISRVTILKILSCLFYLFIIAFTKSYPRFHLFIILLHKITQMILFISHLCIDNNIMEQKKKSVLDKQLSHLPKLKSSVRKFRHFLLKIYKQNVI